jgi:hypothetical protein
MDIEALESYLATILSRYGDEIAYPITWKDHGKVDLDAWAHYFDDVRGREYVLLYEDFPDGSFLKDGLSHDVVPCGKETSLRVTVPPEFRVDGTTGYYTLYREK